MGSIRQIVFHVTLIADTNAGTARGAPTGFTIPAGGQIGYVAGTNYGGAIAYKIQAGAPAEEDPEWTGIGTNWASTHIVFNLGGGATSMYAMVSGSPCSSSSS